METLPEDATGWEHYHAVMFPGWEQRELSGFIRWKIQSTGINVARSLREARNLARAQYEQGRGAPEQWVLAHPPAVLYFPFSAHSACLRCEYFAQTASELEGAAALARQHALAEGCAPQQVAQPFLPVLAGTWFEVPALSLV